jgi:putative ABC transport system ATP-binding protein
MTTTAATILPRQRTATKVSAAELRLVTLATHRPHRHQILLDNVSVAVERGEIMSVLSRHDTAASKFLDVLDGRLAPSWGSVQVAGHELTRLGHRDLSRLRRDHIARVLPAYGVHGRLPVRQNLVVAQRRLGRPTDLGWVDQVADLLELHGMLGYRSAEGADVRRARWAVARALVTRPSLVLGNDITAGLSRVDEEELLAAFAVAARQLGAGVVLATRDPVTASSADRVLLLTHGKIADDTAAA